MKLALAWIYFARALIILVFFFAPKTTLTFLLFAAAIGFSYLSTVPPTIGLVIKSVIVNSSEQPSGVGG